MAIVDRSLLLQGTDLEERTVPIKAFDGEVVVKPLSAAYANEAQSKALEMVTVNGEQIARVNTKTLEVLQVLHGLIEPKLNSELEAATFMERWGPGAREVVNAIDEASLIDKEAIAETTAKFPAGEAVEGTDGADAVDRADPAPVGAGDPGPDLPG